MGARSSSLALGPLCSSQHRTRTNPSNRTELRARLAGGSELLVWRAAVTDGLFLDGVGTFGDDARYRLYNSCSCLRHLESRFRCSAVEVHRSIGLSRPRSHPRQSTNCMPWNHEQTPAAL